MQPFLTRLALDDNADERAIKRAYARELREIDPEKDPVGFQRLHEAYREALSWAEQRADAPSMAAMESATATPQMPAEPTSRWPHLANPALRLHFGDHASQASNAYEGFMQHLHNQRTTNPRYNERHAVADLLAQLADDELTSLEAAVAFEYLVVQGVIDGWRSGHDLLLPAAIEVFGWERTRNRLREFGVTGETMMQVVEQWHAFSLMLAHSTRGIQVLLAKLRSDQPPSDDALRFYSALLRELKQQYALLLPMLAPSEKIQCWLDTPLPMAWVPQKMIDLRDVRERPAPSWYPAWTSAYRRPLVGVMIALVALLFLYADFVRRDSRQTAASRPQAPSRLEDFKDVREALKAPPQESVTGGTRKEADTKSKKAH